jgi:hypothetical protein
LKISEDGKISHSHGLAGLIVKIAIRPKAIYRLDVIPIKIPTQFFTELDKAICKVIWNNKNLRIAKTILNIKRTSCEITMPDSNCNTEQF